MAKRESSEDWSSFFDPTTRVRRGLCPVTLQDGITESHALYFEQHGSGPEKIVLIMGLNSTSFSWAPQVDYFAKNPRYSVLVFDNRGVGHSEAPRGPYTTRGMADDVLKLLDYVGWNGKRSLNIVGLSLGGMIALELLDRIPERVISLLLAVTTAGSRLPWNNVSPWKGTSTLTRMLLDKDPKNIVRLAMEMIFPVEWLDAKIDGDAEDQTNREAMRQMLLARREVTRPQTTMGSMSQMAAALMHYVSPERLHKISKSIPKVTVLTGDEDNLVAPSNSLYLSKQMPEAEYVVWDHTGHALQQQWPTRFSELVERNIKEGKEVLASGTFDG
ncbi:alpha/beta-hydrolase [Dacryopinax primogenitus]|uniref:Alpha/beta-hydrolase n=1 Tax=Dacryopinax primogenitus (strain DJM 731) TaxID=1858805 RepID=M5FT18_DACPD|nr:alpha/beta-hydrolase [Dacryopinax primogenitus]EJT98504.1 alpha/beta-hydrolase [Dacryopinax primogenitus]